MNTREYYQYKPAVLFSRKLNITNNSLIVAYSVKHQKRPKSKSRNVSYIFHYWKLSPIWLPN